MNGRLFHAAPLLLLVVSCSTLDPQIGVSVYVGNTSIHNYRPKSNLTIKPTPVEQSKYPAVDFHCHWSLEQDPHQMLQAMDNLGIAQAVNLSGGWGTKLEAMLAKFHRVDPERFSIFCNIDFARIDEPGFGPEMVESLVQAHNRGAAGLKVFKSLGLRHRDNRGRLIAIDDPRLDPIWAKAGQLGMPVLIHTADPIAFFKPIDCFNERWMQLQRHPDWAFGSDEYPGRSELLSQRNRVIARHRQTNFIGAHVANSAEDLTTVSAWLEAYPNLYLDISGRVAELGRQPYTARRFFMQYQDRILFGTDRYPGNPRQPRYRIYYRFLETDDEYFNYYNHPFPPAGEWKIYGLFLPDEVLEKVYRGNAQRLLTQQQAKSP